MAWGLGCRAVVLTGCEERGTFRWSLAPLGPETAHERVREEKGGKIVRACVRAYRRWTDGNTDGIACLPRSDALVCGDREIERKTGTLPERERERERER